MNTFQKICSLLLCLICLFRVINFSIADSIPELVILVYMTGGDLESDGGAASADLKEMMQSISSDPNIQIVAMASGAKKWELDIPSDETSIYEIETGEMVCVQHGISRNMGTAETLSYFLHFVEVNYPAKQYGLVFWDHGAGPLGGVCFDERFYDEEEMDRLTLNEINEALSLSSFANKKMEFIGFDACLMATLEVAAMISPYANYMIASQETEPSTGWNYSFLQDITGRETGDEIGRMIIDAYRLSLSGNLRPVTLSCVDLNRVNNVLSIMDGFFREQEMIVSKRTYMDYTRSRSLSKSFGNSTASYFDLIDLIDLIGLYRDEQGIDTSDVISAIEDMIVYQYSANEEYVNGISIYYPFDNKTLYETEWSSAYSRMEFIPGYQAFIQKISKIYIGDALMNWKSSYQTLLQEEVGTVWVSMLLNTEEQKQAIRPRLIVLEKIQEGMYQRIYSNYDEFLYSGQNLLAAYHGEALFVVNENGEILAGPLTYYPVDNSIVIYGVVYYDFNPELPYGTQKFSDAVKLVYARGDNGNLYMTDVMIVEDKKNDLSLPSAVDLTKCTDLILINAGPSSITALDDTLLSKEILYNPAKGAPLLAFLPVYGMNDRYAYIRLDDLQGNAICSEVVKIPNPTLFSVSPEQICVDNDQVFLQLKSAEMVSGYNAGIKCIFNIANRTLDSLDVRIQNVSMNNQLLDSFFWNSISLSPNEDDEIVLFVDSSAISEAELSHAYMMNVTISLQANDGEKTEIVTDIPLQLDTSLFDLSE